FHVVHADERVIVARADERELRAVGRPGRKTLASPFLDERNAARVHGCRVAASNACMVELTVAGEHDMLPVGREFWSAAASSAAAQAGRLISGEDRETPRA